MASKCRNKPDMYNLLTREEMLYIPPAQYSTQTFLRSLMNGDKKCIRCIEVKVIKIPHYEGLTVRDIIKFTESKISIKDYLPNYDYPKEPNKEWL